jgi:hypothetical protein
MTRINNDGNLFVNNTQVDFKRLQLEHDKLLKEHSVMLEELGKKINSSTVTGWTIAILGFMATITVSIPIALSYLGYNEVIKQNGIIKDQNEVIKDQNKVIQELKDTIQKQNEEQAKEIIRIQEKLNYLQSK